MQPAVPVSSLRSFDYKALQSIWLEVVDACINYFQHSAIAVTRTCVHSSSINIKHYLIGGCLPIIFCGHTLLYVKYNNANLQITLAKTVECYF